VLVVEQDEAPDPAELSPFDYVRVMLASQCISQLVTNLPKRCHLEDPLHALPLVRAAGFGSPERTGGNPFGPTNVMPDNARGKQIVLALQWITQPWARAQEQQRPKIPHPGDPR
jgi:hypothetical protein